MSDAGNAGYPSRILRAASRRPADGMEAVMPVPAVDPMVAEADHIVARAEAQARTIVNESLQQAEDIRELASTEAQYERETRLAEELLKFSRRMRKEIDDIRPRLARLVVEAVEAIIGTLPEEEVAERMVRQGLRDLDAQARVTLHCSRADRPVLAAIVERMAAAGEQSISAVDTDADLETGTCRLESGGISVELGIRAQLDLLEELLLREEQGPPTRDMRRDDADDSYTETSFDDQPPETGYDA